jgi:regulator of sirC expression with transglutaminase-like and TPR domain
VLPPSDKDIRALIGLLVDDEDSYELVRTQLLKMGEAVIPYIEEKRAAAQPEVAARMDAVCREVRFEKLKHEFWRLATAPECDLETGTLLLVKFGYPGLDTDVYKRWMDEVAAHVERDLPKDADEATRFSRLNAHVFQAMGFSGNDLHYYDPENSYLNRLIEKRRGIPVSMAVLYLLLARRLKISAFGVGTPGHFLVGYRGPEDRCYLDVYNKGRLMSAADVQKMLARAGYEFRPEYLHPANSRDIVIRMMRNLISIYQKMGAVERGEQLSTLVEIMLSRRKNP